MKYLSPKLVVICMLIALSTLGVAAQDGPPSEEASQFAPQRPNLLENLGLNQDQIRQIRIMNRDRKPVMEAAQQRLRESNRALDEAIYSDRLDESEIQARLLAFQAAQAEVSRIRFQSEVELRKILTPEQLTKFRQLRSRLARARENFQQRRRQQQGDRPLQRIRQLPRQQPPRLN